MSNKENIHFKISETSLSNLSNETAIRYDGPITTEEGSSHRNLNNSISFISTSSENSRIAISVYGNDIKIDSPLKIGMCYSFLYFRGFPLITLGPECICNKTFFML